MSARKIRRADALKARKLARKAGFPSIPPEPAIDATTTAVAAEEEAVQPPISDARLAANRANGAKSHGALTPETKLASAFNHTIHGLARHQNGHFKILEIEDATVFESFKQSLLDEHQPETPTEIILVNRMVESEWLAQRATRLQQAFTDPKTGIATDDKKFSLYMRYQITHNRSFHRCFSDLQKMRAEKRKAERGVEAQRAKQVLEKRENERHEMKKVTHAIETFQKDVTAHLDLEKLITRTEQAEKENPHFAEKYNAQVEKHGLDKAWWEVKSQAA